MEPRGKEPCYLDSQLEEDGWFGASQIHQSDRILDRFVDDIAYPSVYHDIRSYYGYPGDISDDITYVSFPDSPERTVNKSEVRGTPVYGHGKETVDPEETSLENPRWCSTTGSSQPIRLSSKDFSPDEMVELLEHIRCPDCQGDGDPVEGLTVKFCGNCHHPFGFDDSMHLDDLERLLSENKVVVKPTTRCACGNDDVDRLVIVAIDDATGNPVIQCQLCKGFVQLGVVDYEDGEKGLDDRSESDSNKREFSPGTRKNPTTSPGDFLGDLQSSLSCKNCGVWEEDLFEKQYDVTNRMTSFKCLACFETEVLTPTEGLLVCPVCRNDKEDRFDVFYGEDGEVVSSICRNCLNVFDHPWKSHTDESRDSVSPVSTASGRRIKTLKTQVRSIDEVDVGDHVTWHRDYGVWHHAIVTAVKPRDRKLTVVHYTGSVVKHEGQRVSVREEDVEIDPRRERLFVHRYLDDWSVSPSDVVARARSRIGEHSYNLISSNCEHFAYWCKTGTGYSSQVKSFCRRLWKTCGSALSVGVREGVVSACRGVAEGLPAKRVLGIGFQEGLNRLRGVPGGSGVAAKLAGGAVVFDVFLNLALEAGLFAYCACRARQKLKAGEISQEEYRRRLCQAGCECAGGFLGATGGGFLGQLAIPVPFLGSLIGCTLGTLIGRLVGSVVGKKMSDKFFDKR